MEIHQEMGGMVIVIVMGDLNTIVEEGCEQKVVGAYGIRRRNDRRRMLIDFCQRHDLVLTNTWFKKSKHNDCTSTLGRTLMTSPAIR